MKITQILLFSVVVSGTAMAADDNGQGAYVSQLCHIVSSEKKVSSADGYIEKMKSSQASSQSSSAMQQPEFDEETAEEVTSAWLQLGEDERAKLRSDEPQCEQTLMMQFQQED